MRSHARSGPRITLVEDPEALDDPVKNLLTSIHLHPGSDAEPVRSLLHEPNGWVYKGKVFQVQSAEAISDEDLKLRIKHEVIRREEKMQQIRRKVEASESLDRLPSARRERIPESVRMFVWRRDGGRCVQCSSKERLEFDHIIPVVEGGASTERNIQLLCEVCNRKKGQRI